MRLNNMTMTRRFIVVFLCQRWLSVAVLGQESTGSDASSIPRLVTKTSIEECLADGTCHTVADDDGGFDITTADVNNDDLPLCADDEEDDCVDWAEMGECDKNPEYMRLYCRKSCDLCADESFDLLHGEDIGVMQILSPGIEKEILELIRATRAYIRDTVYQDPSYSTIKSVCRNRQEACAYWAVTGECQNNIAFMNTSCAPVCQTCEFLDMKRRCPMDPNATNIWQPGDLNNMFERLTTHTDYQKYEPKILSRPDYAPGDNTESNATYQLGPWVITFENVISAEEASRLIELGGKQGYERSGGVGKMKPDGTIESDIVEMRTSMNAWCGDECYRDPIAKDVMERLGNFTQIPDGNTEFLQLLRYEVGQFYKTHHDYIEYEVDRPGGVRVLTVFMYLNEVEAGGGTNFPKLNLTVMPKVGRALIWPSVLNDDPHKIDERTEHQALPVEKGIKYGANAWMHQRDFKAAYHKNCN